MPYSKISDLPPGVKNNLPEHAQHIFMAAFNSAYKDTCNGDDGCASRVAWAAVGKSYEKKGGKWVKKESFVADSFYLTITKANYDKSTGKYKFSAVASDTDYDSYMERMSLALFNDFIARAKRKEAPPEKFRSNFWSGGNPYLSVAHYFDLEGKGAAGQVTSMAIDGNELKAWGEFSDTPLGKAAYLAVKKSLNDSPTAEDDSQKKIRISIAFLDYGHQHGQNPPFYRKTGTNVRCPYCEKGVGDVQYLRGLLIHLALTRVPVNERTDIIGGTEVMKSMSKIQTRKDDAASIVGEELAGELEKESLLVGKSETDQDEMVVIKSEETVTTSDGKGNVETHTMDLPDMQIKADVIPGVDRLEEPVQDAISKRPDTNPKEGEKKYGDVNYADETNKKYPLDTKKHIEAAWRYIGMPKNQKKYSSEEVAAIKRKIVAAWHKVIGKDGPPSEQEKSEVSDDVALLAMSYEMDDLYEELAQLKPMLAKAPKSVSPPEERNVEDQDTGQTDLTAEQEDADEAAMDAVNGPMKPENPAMSDQDPDMEKWRQYMSKHPAMMKSMLGFMDAFNVAIQDHQGEDALRNIQQPYEELGQAIKSYVEELSQAAKKEKVTPIAGSLSMDDIRKVLSETLSPIVEKVGLLTAEVSVLKSASLIQASAPVQQPPHRAITGAQLPPEVRSNLQSSNPDPGRPMTLKEIAHRSVYGNTGQ